VSILRRTAPRYADAPHLAAFGLPTTALSSVPAFLGTVSHTGSGAATVAPGGRPAGVYAVRVRVSTAGAPGVGAVEVSLNGGTSYGSPIAVPSNGIVAVPATSSSIASGLTLTVAGTLAAGDVYAFDAASAVELALDAASDWLDGYFARTDLVLPLTAWDMAVSGAAAAHAALEVLTARGFDPQNPSDANIVSASDRATKWAEKVATGYVKPRVTDSSDPVVGPDAAEVIIVSAPRRGW